MELIYIRQRFDKRVRMYTLRDVLLMMCGIVDGGTDCIEVCWFILFFAVVF